jgi:hypothetical protein
MKLFVADAAGFTGFPTSQLSPGCGDELVGLDNLNGYDDVSLKQA